MHEDPIMSNDAYIISVKRNIIQQPRVEYFVPVRSGQNAKLGQFRGLLNGMQSEVVVFRGVVPMDHDVVDFMSESGSRKVPLLGLGNAGAAEFEWRHQCFARIDFKESKSLCRGTGGPIIPWNMPVGCGAPVMELKARDTR
jgi:hypothetical protein